MLLSHGHYARRKAASHPPIVRRPNCVGRALIGQWGKAIRQSSNTSSGFNSACLSSARAAGIQGDDLGLDLADLLLVVRHHHRLEITVAFLRHLDRDLAQA